MRRLVQKATNWGARSGETISGNLRRGDGGRFSSAGNVKTPAAQAAADRARAEVRSEAKAPAARKGGRKGGAKAKAPKKSIEQRKAERAEAKAKEQAANREEVFGKLGVGKDIASGLMALTEGNQPEGDVAGLISAGLAETAKDGSIRLTRAGQELMNAANVGAAGRAQMLLSESKDKVAKRAEAEAKKQAAAAEKLKAAAAKAKAGKAKKAAAAQASIDRANARSVRENEANARRDEKNRIRQERELALEARRVAANTEELNRQVRLAQIAQLLEDRRLGIVTKERSAAFMVYKSSEGYRWVMTSSTAFQDRDGETVTKAAMEADCEFADWTGDYGPLVWWHTKAVLGHCDFNMVKGPILIESGTFKNEMIAKSFAENAEALGASLGFLPLPWEPRTDGIYTFIRRKERSVLPVEHASNRYTRLIVY
jgi:hypothetical protein